jgi:hypothetical protein
MLTIICPGLAVLFTGRPFTGTVLLILQCTGIGWPIAILIALGNVNDSRANRRYKKLIRRIDNLSDRLLPPAETLTPASIETWDRTAIYGEMPKPELNLVDKLAGKSIFKELT